MRGNGGGSCELRVRVHTSQCIREAVGSGACSHVVGMQGTSRAAAGGNGEVLLTGLGTLLLVCTCNGMLEPGGVGGDGSVSFGPGG